MDDSANPISADPARSAPEPTRARDSTNREQEFAEESILADPKYAACLGRLEARWPKPKLKTPLLSFQRLGRFEIRRELGRGRFGVVFLAWDPKLERQVALKVPQFDAAIDPELRERFRGEALSAGQLQHPGIVALYDVGQHAGVDYIAMAFVDGMTLGDRLQTGPLPPTEAAQLIVQLASAVQHAHDHGVIHRDLKPNNVLLDKAGKPHVTDFGLARRLSDSAMRATHTGQVLGTPAYMSPEQATGQSDIGPASDVYAMGVILYETITGRPPFQAATFVEAVEFILNRDPLPPSKLNPKLPRELDAITFKCLEKRPPNRYASAQELADDLQCYLDGKPIRARTQSYLQKAWRWARKYPSQALLMIASIVLIGLLLTMGVVYDRLQHADALAAQQRTTAETQRYFATVNQARNIITRRQPGWSALALKELQQAAAIDCPVAERGELRYLAAECLVGFDVQREETIAAGMLIGRLESSPDGSLLAVGELKGNASFRVVVYDSTMRRPVHQFSILNSGWMRALKGAGKWQDGVREFAFTSDNRYLAVGLRFGLVYCFDLQKPQEPPRQLIVSKERELEQMTFSADGKVLFALTKDDGQFIRWQDWQRDANYDSPWESKTRSFTVAPFQNEVFSIGYLPNSFRMLDQELQMREFFSPNATLAGRASELLQTNGDGSLLAARTESGVQVFETLAGSLVRRLQDDAAGDESMGHSMQFSLDGQLLTAYHSRGVVRFFDIAQSRQVLRLDLPRHDFQDIAVDPQRRWLAVANDNQLEFWRLNQQHIRQRLSSPNQFAEAMVFSPDGKEFACLTSNGLRYSNYCSTISAWQSETGELLAQRNTGVAHLAWKQEDGTLGWSPSGEVIAATLFGTQVLKLQDHQLTSEGFLPLTGPTSQVTFKVQPSAEKNSVTQIEQIAHPRDPQRNVLRIVPSGELVRLDCRLEHPLQLTNQQAMLTISLKVDADHSFEAPLTMQTSLADSGPQHAAPWVFVSPANPQFQSWTIGLPTKVREIKDFDLYLASTSQVRSLAIERIDCVALAPPPTLVDNFPGLQHIEHVSAAPLTERVWSSANQQISSWSWPSGEKQSTWQNNNHRVTGAGNIRVLQAGRTGTLVGTRDGRVHWLDPKGVSRGIWQGPGAEVVTAALCEEAGVALVGSENGLVRCLSIPSGEVNFDFAADDSAILALAATPDGKRLVTTTANRALTVWRRNGAGRYEVERRLPDPSLVTKAISLSVDGKYLAVMSRITASVELWNLPALEAELQRLGIE